MSNIILETNNLTKAYGAVRAVDDFSIRIEKNKIYGLLGRNGAGKTTLLNLISSRIFANSGRILLSGKNAVENQEMLPHICYIPEKNYFIPTMKVFQILNTASDFFENYDLEYADKLCKMFGLEKKKKYQSLSRGYESILRIVIGMASRAPLTIFDEPVLGLDAAVRDLFYRELLSDYTEKPRTFVISTHLIDESADVFEEAIIIKNGKLVEQLPVEILKDRARYVSGSVPAVDSAISNLKVIFEEMVGNIKICAIYGDFTDNILKKLSSYDVEISAIPVQKLFIYLTNNQ